MVGVDTMTTDGNNPNVKTKRKPKQNPTSTVQHDNENKKKKNNVSKHKGGNTKNDGKRNGKNTPKVTTAGGPAHERKIVNKARAPISAKPATVEEKKIKREHKKKGRYATQQAAVQKKADAEDNYFRQCELEAAAKKKKPTDSKNLMIETAKEAEVLFSKQGAQGINFNNYDAIKVEVKRGGADTTPTTEREQQPGFSEYDELSSFLHPSIQRNIKLMNYTKPTPIQKYAIPLALAGNDLMCCAQTGSGKTCAFLLPIIASIERFKAAAASKNASPSGSAPRHGVAPCCIVMAPTRELAIQIELEARKLCHELPSIRPVVVYGGASQRQQIRALAFGADLIVATPGRLTDFVDRSLVLLDQVKFLVLDEADRMLDMGFEPQIRRLVLQSNMTPKHKGRQTLLFSATFPAKIQVLAKAFLRDSYAWVAVGRVGSTTDSITQVLVQCNTGEKRLKLRLVVKALREGPEGRTLIFAQKKRTATWLKKQLNNGGPADGDKDERFPPISAVDIHGDRSQSQRESALASFRSGTCRVLVATDVAARGLDISGVEHVINMDLPVASDDFDSYVHRIGRTGRAGHTGLATSLYVPGNSPKVGNQAIASQLIHQLKESGQKVETWLEQEVAAGGGGNGRPAKQNFGGSDVRQGGGRGGRGGRGGNGGRGGKQRGRGRGGRGS